MPAKCMHGIDTFLKNHTFLATFQKNKINVNMIARFR
uniref:Uncharacterized protein n=1 Tax=Anguilla anguilla TaxID=7936 RepID=A0A0E9WLX3_ANGAN